MAERTLLIEGETALASLAAALAPLLEKGDVIALSGGLGAGKTALARALIRVCAGDADLEVPSPTFTLVQVYELPRLSLWHFDLYRLEQKEIDILELGWDDARKDGVALVEWPDRLGGLLPGNRLEIKVEFVEDSENKRRITLSPFGEWEARLKEMKP